MKSFVSPGFGVVFLVQAVFAKRTGGVLDTTDGARSFNITITTLRHTYLHPDYFGPTTELQLHDSNRYSMRWEILKTFPTHAKSIVHTYEKNKRGEYLPSITVRETVCEEFQKQVQHLPIYACYRFHEAGFRECPFKKGTYIAPHVGCTAADCPIVTPGRFWRFNKTWVSEDNVLLSATQLDFTVNRKQVFKKQ